MKVLAVTTWFPSSAAPVMGIFVQKDVLALSQDHDVTVVHLARSDVMATSPASELVHGVQVQRVLLDPKRPLSALSAMRTLRRLVRDADLVHTMAFSSILAVGPGRPPVPWVHSEHWSGWTARRSLSPLLRAAMQVLVRAIRRPDVVAAVSQFLAEPIRQVRPGPTVIVPCIVAAPDRLTPRRPSAARPLELVSIGGLVEGKDPVTAVRAVAELCRRGVACRLTWLGEGPLRDEVEQEVARLGLVDAVRLPGAVLPDRVSAELDHADLFLLPTRSGTFCISAAEALAHGRPVVIGANGGQTGFVTREVGELVPERDPVAYADAVERVLERLSSVPAESIAEDVRSRYSRDAFRRSFGEVYALAQEVRRGRRG